MLIVDVEGQVVSFLLSILLGAVFCIMYDLLRSLHKLYIKGFAEVFVLDLLFWFVCAIITYLFLVIYCNGIVRGFVVIGALMGFLAVRIILSKYILLIFTFVLKFIMGILHFVCAKIVGILVPINKYLKKYILKVKKCLHMLVKVMYNQLKIKVFNLKREKGSLNGNRS